MNPESKLQRLLAEPPPLDPHERVLVEALARLPPAPDIPADALNRVWRRLRSRRGRAPRRSTLALVLTTALAVAAAGIWLARSRPAGPSRSPARDVKPARSEARPGRGPVRLAPLTQLAQTRSRAGDVALVWTSGFETDDLSEWMQPGEDFPRAYADLGTRVQMVQDPVKSGQRALEVGMTTSDGQYRLAALTRERGLPREGVYKASFFFPQRYESPRYWTIFRFLARPAPGEGARDIWLLTVVNRADGEMVLGLHDARGSRHLRQPSPVALPVRRWVDLEVAFAASSDESGRIVVWQDGIKIFEELGIATTSTPWVQWSVGSSGVGMSPSPAVIYLDDISISAL